MDLDTRARRAADGVRTSVQGVDPMAQITELRHEEHTRRRSKTVAAVVGTVVVVASAGWLVGWQSSGDPGSAPPASTPTTSPPNGEFQAGQPIGSHMNPPMEAKAPKSWAVDEDVAPWVRVTRGSLTVEIQGPMNGLITTVNGDCCYYPGFKNDGYANWLRTWGAGVDVLEDGMVAVEGEQVAQLTLRVRESPWFLGEVRGMAEVEGPWTELHKGDVVTITVLEVDGETMLVASHGAETGVEARELRSAHEFVLSTLELPD